MDKLGSLKRIKDLRSVWPNEAKDFTVWLANKENLAILSREIGVDIILGETESSVGNFNVDIFATEENTGRRIVIENQLEDTNHDHLGKVITYASGKDAKIVIWIVRHARDEHRKAIEWLNNHTDEDIAFFLVELELWKIDDSRMAPKFNIIEQPNNWSKTLKVIPALRGAKKIQLEFWQFFRDYASSQDDFSSIFSLRRARAQHWYDLGVGNSACYIRLTVNTKDGRIGAEVYIPDDKALFYHLKEHKEEIESIVGVRLKFIDAEKASRIVVYANGDIKDSTVAWEWHYKWFCDMALRLRNVTDAFCR